MSYMNKTSKLDEMLHEAPCATFDFYTDLPGMTLQRLDCGVWRDYMVDNEVVKSPVDINKLPSGNYRFVD